MAEIPAAGGQFSSLYKMLYVREYKLEPRMKTTSISDFRSRMAELLDGTEPVLVTRDGRNAALVYPLSDPAKIPLELRRKLFREITDGIARQLQTKGVTDEQIDRDFSAYKKHRRR